MNRETWLLVVGLATLAWLWTEADQPKRAIRWLLLLLSRGLQIAGAELENRVISESENNAAEPKRKRKSPRVKSRKKS